MLVYPRSNGIMKYYDQFLTLPSLKILLEKLFKFQSLGHTPLFKQFTVIYKKIQSVKWRLYIIQ